MEHNPSVRFVLLGDRSPRAHTVRWPGNIVFRRMALQTVLVRVRSALGVTPSRSLMSVEAGGGSKISDLKPMLAHLFPERVEGCDF